MQGYEGAYRSRNEGNNAAKGLSSKLETFGGDLGDDPSAWLTKFELNAEFYRWDAEDKLRALPLSLAGIAFSWHRDLERHVKSDWRLLRQQFLERFAPAKLRWVENTELQNRTQAEDESLQAFLKDIHTRCSKLQKSDEEKLGIILRGLLAPLRKFVLAHSPTTASEAESFARLAESINAIPDDPTPSRSDRLEAMLSSVATPLDMKVGQLKQDVDELRKTLEAAIKAQSNPDQPRFGEFDSRKQNFGYTERRCFTCGSISHLARDCSRRSNYAYGNDNRGYNRNRYYDNRNNQGGYRPNRYDNRDNGYRRGEIGAYAARAEGPGSKN